MYTKNHNELEVCKVESDYIPKHLLKLDLSKTIRIKREDAFRDSNSRLTSSLHGGAQEPLVDTVPEPESGDHL